MLQYRDGRFHALGVSFRLPEGFFLETVPQFCYENGFGAWSCDMQCYMEWQIEQYCNGTKEELEQLFFEGSKLTPLSEIMTMTVNNMQGHHVKYTDGAQQYWEFRLSVRDDIEISLLVRPRSGDIQALSTSPHLKPALFGISAD